MTRTIHKQTLETIYEQEIELEVMSKILCIQMQRNKPCMWYECTPGANKVRMKIYCYGTGHPKKDMVDLHIGTIQINDLVFHYFMEV